MPHDITRPPRLAVGSHPAGSGRACAMNVLSWEQGDLEITDFPTCTARPLASLVQQVNDGYCRHGGKGSLLCPTCSLHVLDLAHSTVGTADAADADVWRWLAEAARARFWCTTQTAWSGLAARIEFAVFARYLRAVADGEPGALEELRQLSISAGAAALRVAGSADTCTNLAINLMCTFRQRGGRPTGMQLASGVVHVYNYVPARSIPAAEAIAEWKRITGTGGDQRPSDEDVAATFARIEVSP